VAILHDDAEQYAYTEAAEELLAPAKQGGWTVVSMKDNWASVFDAGV
jgi:hypothetical protein